MVHLRNDANGFTYISQIYEETFESISFKLQQEEEKKIGNKTSIPDGKLGNKTSIPDGKLGNKTSIPDGELFTILVIFEKISLVRIRICFGGYESGK